MKFPGAFRAALCALVLVASASLAPGQAAATPSPATKKKLALVGGMLLDGYDGVPPVHRAAILIEGDRILRVGPASEVRSRRTPRSSTPAAAS